MRQPAFLETLDPPYVLKADGLAAGKGVLIMNDYNEAVSELSAMLGGRFGAAGNKVVIEQYPVRNRNVSICHNRRHLI